MKSSPYAALLATLVFAVSGLAQKGDTAPPSRALLLELTREARLAGTSGSLRAAEMVAHHLAEAGWQVELDEREVLLSLPRRLEVALYADDLAEKALHERIERFDPDAIPAGDIPPFNAWSASGIVRAPVVDCGYGLRPDFERLKKARVDLEGKIALCRYGKGYRGVKVDLATQFGCAGVLLFSDPTDDGAAKGPTWPDGPWKPPHDAQRGSISPMGRAPGDPSTPGFGSPKKGERVPGHDRLAAGGYDALLPTIPCMPIGAAEAEQILERLATKRMVGEDGERTPQKIGPGPVEARLTVDAPRDLRTIRNVIAHLPGASEHTVIAGNHRDAWVRGAHDAGSGTVALLRAAQHLSQRVADGWVPAYTITLAFWDAEESGLIGSTEWGEAHGKWLQEHAIAYVNADAAVSGTKLRVSGTPGLEAVIAHTLDQLPELAKQAMGEDGNLFEQWTREDGSAPSGPWSKPKMGLPGSGSDFTVFLHHLSVPSIDFGFSGNRGGQYHTRFDDFLMVERYLDPGFVGHEMAGEFVAELLASFATFGPYSFDPEYAAYSLSRFSLEAAEWLGEERARALHDAFRRLKSAGGWGSWPDHNVVEASERQLGVSHRWVVYEAITGGETLDSKLTLDRSQPYLDHPLYRSLAIDKGLPGRPWFKNRLWAPGLEKGYGADTFPTLRLAAEEGDEALDRELASLIADIDALARAWAPAIPEHERDAEAKGE